MGEVDLRKFGGAGLSSGEDPSQCGAGAAKIEPNEFGIPLSVNPEDIEALNEAYSRGLPNADQRFRLPLGNRANVFCYKFDQPKLNQVDTEQVAHMSGENDFPSCEEVLTSNPLAGEICEDMRMRVMDYEFKKEPWYKDFSSVLIVGVVGLYASSTIIGMGFHDGGVLSQAGHGLDAAKWVAVGGAKVFGALGAVGTAIAVGIAADVGALVYIGFKNDELNDKIFVMANASGVLMYRSEDGELQDRPVNVAKTVIEDNGPSVWRADANWSVDEFRNADGKLQFTPEKDSKMAKPAFKNPEVVVETNAAGDVLINTDGSIVWHWEEKNY